MQVLKRTSYSLWIATIMVAVAVFFSVALGQAEAGQKELSTEQLQQL